MIDAVLSYHANGHTCGVAKFSAQLARHLGVPHLSLGQHPVRYPLICIMSCEDPTDWPHRALWYHTFDLFVHDDPHGLSSNEALGRAQRIIAANAEIGDQVRQRMRAYGIQPKEEIIESFCPATIHGNPERGRINVLTFGMAHKIQAHRYEKLKALLDATGQPYTVSLSTAVHEGTPWDLTATVPDALRTIFGDHLRYLGYLADDALAKELRDCTAVALFYNPALRANNTTFWAAYDAGQKIVTNLDAYSPRHVGVDLEALDAWVDLYRLSDRQRVDTSTPTWAALVNQLRQPVSV